MDKEYIVTLKSKDDLEDFYAEMSSNGFKIAKKRPISRNTHYYMTAEQAEELKKDSRVVDVEEVTDRVTEISRAIYNNTSYTKNGVFSKNNSYFTGLSYVQTGASASGGIPANSIKVTLTNHDYAVNDEIFWTKSDFSVYYNRVSISSIVDANNFIFAIPGSPPNTSASGTCQVLKYNNSTDLQWGHVHCAGTSSQRAKGTFGKKSEGATDENVNTSVDIHNDGKHVDVVIVDGPMAYDLAEWKSPSTNNSRFVQYQWFNELNSIVSSIDDDSQTLPTGTITYRQGTAESRSHGIHVGSTVAGKYYGWAREANIYNMAITASYASGQRFSGLYVHDYLRAFHLNKTVNSTTGRRNPTITNHSYGSAYYMQADGGNFEFGDLVSVTWRGTTYNSGNPNSSGWSQSGVQTDFGITFGLEYYPAYSAAVAADVQDAIDDGVVFVGAAGNDNLLLAEYNDADWNNTIGYQYDASTVYQSYFCRGGAPNTPDVPVINVGSLNNTRNFTRATSTQYGPGITVFAPGVRILGAYGNTGNDDTKTGYGTGNYFGTMSGTSMASPQVCGVLATLETAKRRFSQSDAIGYLQRHSVLNDMTFDTGNGSHGDDTCQKGSPNKYLISKNPRPTTGMIEDVKGERKTSGMTFPRRPTLNYVS